MRTSVPTAEMVKYASNAFLATKISFINEIANVCEEVGADVVTVAKFLHDHPVCQFVNIIDVTAVDWPSREKRFDVVYHFLSPRLNQRVRQKVATDETTPVPSLIDVYRGADWFERETYDLYGVLFTGHPDMRRILTDYGFEGHPLRKDFPILGPEVEVNPRDNVHTLHQSPPPFISKLWRKGDIRGKSDS